MKTRVPVGLFARLLAIAGTLVLILGATGDQRWVDYPWALLIMIVADGGAPHARRLDHEVSRP
jgi:hypothetical protein